MIQWFPGHMAKARREISEKLKLVDLVIELRDARAPFSSENPMLHDVIKNKPKIIVLMKSDLADPQKTVTWVQTLSQKQPTIAIDVNQKQDINKFIQLVQDVGHGIQAKQIEKGVNVLAVRAIIAGVPNVGKSTLINRLANKRIAKIGDKPGVTKQQQWIKVRGKFELLDTPGILWPKFEEQVIGYRLAMIGTIKQELIPLDDVAAHLITYLLDQYIEAFEGRYGHVSSNDMWDIFQMIGRKRGALQKGGEIDTEKVSELLLQDFRQGKIGRITLERPDDLPLKG